MVIFMRTCCVSRWNTWHGQLVVNDPLPWGHDKTMIRGD